MSSPEQNEVRTVLVGAAGSGTGFGAVISLRRHWGEMTRIVAVDINQPHLVTTSLISDFFEQAPPSADPTFTPHMVELIERHKIDTYLPLLDQEIWKAANALEAGALPRELRLLAPSPQVAQICLDKLECAEWLGRVGLPVPRTAKAEEAFEAEYYVLKPRCGFGSHGVRHINSAQFKSEAFDHGQWIVQEPCSGPEVTSDAFFDSNTGQFRASHRERIEVKSGVCVKARIFRDDALDNIVRSVAAGLNLRGSFCIQLMRLDKQWVITDINARPGAGSAMSAAVGMDFFAAHFALAWGEDFMRFLPELTCEHFVTRQYSEFVMT